MGARRWFRWEKSVFTTVCTTEEDCGALMHQQQPPCCCCCEKRAGKRGRLLRPCSKMQSSVFEYPQSSRFHEAFAFFLCCCGINFFSSWASRRISQRSCPRAFFSLSRSLGLSSRHPLNCLPPLAPPAAGTSDESSELSPSLLSPFSPAAAAFVQKPEDGLLLPCEGSASHTCEAVHGLVLGYSLRFVWPSIDSFSV